MKKNIFLLFVFIVFLGGCSGNGLPPIPEKTISPKLPVSEGYIQYPFNPEYARAERRREAILRNNTTAKNPQTAAVIPASAQPAPSPKIGRLSALETRLKQIEKMAFRNALAHQKLKNRVGILETKVTFAHPGVKVASNHQGFFPGSWQLSKKDKKILDAIIADVKKNNTKIKVIIGVSDKIGSLQKNQKIAQKRAEEVLKYLKKNGGIPPKNQKEVKIEIEPASNRFCNNRRWLVIIE